MIRVCFWLDMRVCNLTHLRDPSLARVDKKALGDFNGGMGQVQFLKSVRC